MEFLMESDGILTNSIWNKVKKSKRHTLEPGSSMEASAGEDQPMVAPSAMAPR